MSEALLINLGKLLRDMRLTKGHSLRFLAEKIDSTKSYLSRIENGQRVISINFLYGLAGYYGVKASLILRIAEDANTDSLADENSRKLFLKSIKDKRND